MPSPDSAERLRKILGKYFDFELGSDDPGAWPAAEGIQQLHRDLVAEFKHQAARDTWLEVGAQPDPEPLVMVRYHQEGSTENADDITVIQLPWLEARRFIGEYNNTRIWEWTEPATTLTAKRIQRVQIPEGAEVDQYVYMQDFLIDECIVEG